MCEACCKSLLPALVVVCGCVNKRQCNTSTGLAVAAAAAVAVLRLRTKQILFAHTLSKSFAIATGYGHAQRPHSASAHMAHGKGKTACLRFSSCTSLFNAPRPLPPAQPGYSMYCSLGSLFVASLFVRRKYPAPGWDASTTSLRHGHGHELLSDGIRVRSSQIVKLSNCMSIYSLASTLLPLP